MPPRRPCASSGSASGTVTPPYERRKLGLVVQDMAWQSGNIVLNQSSLSRNMEAQAPVEEAWLGARGCVGPGGGGARGCVPVRQRVQEDVGAEMTRFGASEAGVQVDFRGDGALLRGWEVARWVELERTPRKLPNLVFSTSNCAI